MMFHLLYKRNPMHFVNVPLQSQLAGVERQLLLKGRGFESEDLAAALQEPEVPHDAADQPEGRARHGRRMGQGHRSTGCLMPIHVASSC